MYTVDYIVNNCIDKEYYGFIYITINLINKKMYIGQKNFKRWKIYIGSGSCLKNAIKKHGKENFSRKIIAISRSQDELNELEAYYINLYNAVNSPDYYNVADGGKSGNKFAGKTEEEMIEIKLKMSVSHSGKNNPNFGKPLSEEHKRKIKENHANFSGINHPRYGMFHSEETKKNFVKTRKGKYVGENNSMYGKHHSEESKQKMSECRIGKYANKNHPRAKSVICITTGVIFPTAKEAGKYYNICKGNITQCCKNKYKSAGKHPETGEKLTWMHYEDWLEYI